MAGTNLIPINDASPAHFNENIVIWGDNDAGKKTKKRVRCKAGAIIGQGRWDAKEGIESLRKNRGWEGESDMWDEKLSW